MTFHFDRTLVYFGPPGTGKTTTLMDRVKDAMKSGVPPSRIGYVAFTRAAAAEAKSRAAAVLDLDPSDLPYWGTLHSIAFRQLSLRGSELVSGDHWATLGDLLDMDFGESDEAGRFSPWSRSRGRRVQGIVSYRRSKQLPVDVASLWREYGRTDATLADLYHRTLEAYKATRGLFDYADLIDKAPGAIPVDVLFIDEAQDLTPAQWDYAERLASEAGQVYVAGDDDQAIYAWAGADVDRFLATAGERVVLDKSHRLPRQIWNLATRISSRIKRRQPKGWGPSDREGAVDSVADPRVVDLASGEWLLLARCRHHLEEWEDACQSQGVRYVASGRDSVRRGEVDAIRAWEALRSGKSIDSKLASTALSMTGKPVDLPAGRYAASDLGLKDMPVWRYALTSIPPARVRYYEACLRRDSKALTAPPRVRIMTIHACKGHEADNVAVMTDTTEQVERGAIREPDDEHRVWYVAVTRARERLVLVRPQGPLSYDLGVYKSRGTAV